MQPGSRQHFSPLDGTHIHWVEWGGGRGDRWRAPIEAVENPEAEGPPSRLVGKSEAPPIVMLHGLSDCHRSWNRVAPILARRRRVLTPDLLGHGLSGRPDASYELAWHARMVGRWLDTLDIPQVDVVGHSFGGGVAQWLLLEHRHRVRRVVLVAPGGLGRDVMLALRLCSATGIVERFGQPVMGLGTRAVIQTIGHGAFSQEDIAHLSWVNSMPGTARAFARTVGDVIDWRGQKRHFSDRISDVENLPPFALFWGDRDPVIPHHHLENMMQTFRLADVVRFENTAHFPQLERVDEFVRRLEDFLDRRRVVDTAYREGREKRAAGTR